MRNFILIVFAFCTLQSCLCGKKECGGSIGITVKLDGYNNIYDSVRVERFLKNNAFDNLIFESAYPIVMDKVNDERQFELYFRDIENNFEHDEHDYRITLLSDSNQFEITKLQVNRDAGNKQCGTFTKELMICPTESIQVNGSRAQLLKDDDILLTK